MEERAWEQDRRVREKRENKPFSEQLIALRTKQSHTDGSLSTPYQDITINQKLNKDKYKQIDISSLHQKKYRSSFEITS